MHGIAVTLLTDAKSARRIQLAGPSAALPSTCLVAVAVASHRRAAGALSARGAPRPVRRRSEAFEEGGRRLGDGVIDSDCVGPSADRGRPIAVGFGPRLCAVDRPGGTVASAL
jgi:hypothetical protein